MHRTLTVLAALAAIGLGTALGARVAERWQARSIAPPPVESVPEPSVFERPAYDPVECDGDVPANEMSYGTATLRLTLLDSRDGVPAATRVRLWRLDVPEDALWSAGDEMRGSLAVPEAGVSIERLPVGRYRLQILDSSDGSDPPAFDVDDGVSEREVAVDVRHWFRLRLRLVDEHGEVVRRCMRVEGGGPSSHFSDDPEPAPEWAHPREPKSKPLVESEFRIGGVGHDYPQETGPIVQANDDGYFDLGRHREPRRGDYHWRGISFVPESRANAYVHVDAKIGVDSTFVCVAPSIRALLARVVLPYGDEPDHSNTRVTAWSDAKLYGWDAPADAWRTIPVHVRVTAPRCEQLDFVWTAATADAEHHLVPLPPKSLK